MASPIEVILIPTLMILLGYVLKRQDILHTQDSKTLSKIVLNVCLPSLIFVNISVANITSDMMLLPFAGLFLSLICMIIAFAFCRMRAYSKVKTWTVMIAASMMNTGFLGFPITLGVFGNEGFLHAIFFDLSTTFIFVIFGMVLVGMFGGERREVFKQAIVFVPIWAVIVGLIFNFFDVQYGYVLESTLNYLGQATIPLIMISLGLTLDFKDIKSAWGDSLFVSGVKLVIAPILMFAILSMLHFGGLSFKVAVLEAGMSTAMNALVLAINYGLDTKLMSSIIFTDTVLALGTLTVLISFLI